MPFVATRMDLEIITLSEVSQTSKDKYMVSPISRIWGVPGVTEVKNLPASADWIPGSEEPLQ